MFAYLSQTFSTHLLLKDNLFLSSRIYKWFSIQNSLKRVLNTKPWNEMVNLHEMVNLYVNYYFYIKCSGLVSLESYSYLLSENVDNFFWHYSAFCWHQQIQGHLIHSNSKQILSRLATCEISDSNMLKSCCHCRISGS